ncbi:DNA-binding transcriptional regulator, LysR family [Celeribacter baekdonensis]|uniref:HTH-type transcriptional regulator CbbR n=3 Tax=Roseobacteraceae TaxID=2854170 RepID=A0A1G7QS20_9RHOB|nr:DNA-binding transcriptional regulator, LysR family [Celeribacter baekdonensis]
MRYSLRQMQIFREVAAHLSYTRAAEALNLTQPATFAQVRQLEDHLGQKLIDRLGKSLSLTQAGEIVLKSAQRLIEETENLDMALAELQGLAKGRLRLAVVSTAKYDIPAHIGAYNTEFPGIEIALTVGNREELLSRFASNADDLYILGTPPQDMDAVVERYSENPLVVIAPPDHPLAARSELTMRDLANYPFLMRESGSGTRLAAERSFEAAGAAPNVRMELGANESVKQGVIAGLGLAVLSRGTVALELRHGYLVELAVEPFPIIRHWHVVWRKEKKLSLAAEAFVERLFARGAA